MSTRKRPNKGPTITTKTTTGSRPAATKTSGAPRPDAMKPAANASRPVAAQSTGSPSRPVAADQRANGSARPSGSLASAPRQQPASERSAAHSRPAGAPQASATAVAVKPSKASWFSSIIRAFPYLGAAYVIFLGAIEAGTLAAAITGIALALAGIFLLFPRSDGVDDGAPQIPALLSFRKDVASWVGEVRSVAFGLFALCIGLLLWDTWHASDIQLFSWLSLVALVVALALIVRASYLRKEA